MDEKREPRGGVLGDNPFGGGLPPAGVSLPRPAAEKAKKEKKKAARVTGPRRRPAGKRAPARAAAAAEKRRREGGDLADAERRITRIIEEVEQAQEGGQGDRESLVEFASRVQSKMTALQVEAGGEGRVLATLLRLLRPSFYLRKAAPLVLAGRGIETDEFGFDPVLDRTMRPLWRFLFDRWFRVRVSGLANVPPSGGCVIAANHLPALVLDGILLRHALVETRRPDARWLVEEELLRAPYVGQLAQRAGGVRACPENAGALLERGAALIVFPEGMPRLGEAIGELYSLGRFGRGGFARLAVRHGVPVVPAAVVGPRNPLSSPCLAGLGETGPLGALRALLEEVKVPGAVGAVPIPFRWSVALGGPVRFDFPPGARLDQATAVRLGAEVQGRVRGLLRSLLDRGAP